MSEHNQEIHNQDVVVTLNPFRKLASVWRTSLGREYVADLEHYDRGQYATNTMGELASGYRYQTAIAKAMRQHPKNEWCQMVVSTDLTVHQANDLIRWSNREYKAQGYKLLTNEKMI